MLKGIRKSTLHILLMLTLIGVSACKKDEPPVEKSELQKKIDEYNLSEEGLKDFYTPEAFFYMGVAVKPSLLTNTVKTLLIKRHFNSVTCENEMKWSSLQPTEGNFNFTSADNIVSFAISNGMKIRGHTLCWHNQVPDWIFLDGGVTASKELVLKRLRDHVTAVVTHFKGKVYAWDVVNEAIDDGSSVYRDSKWYQICGEDFIFEAFSAARAADPDAKLFYNDYSAVNAAKRDKIYDLLVKLKTRGLVDGIGLQGHWNISWPSSDLISAAFEKFASLGVDIQVTELDVSVYTSGSAPESEYTADIEQKQTSAYERYFMAFRNYRENITGITFWGLADDYSWLDNFPVAGRKNYPLLFDENLQPKQAYFKIIDF